MVISVMWTTVAVGISPMPSNNKARDVIMQLVETAGDGAIVDLGSGWGSLIIPLAMKYPGRQVLGYELSFVPWLTTVLISKLLHLKNLSVHRKNFLQADLSTASVLVCYLFPEGMKALEKKLVTEKALPRYLISNTFALPSYEPEQTIRLNDMYRSPIYRYKFDWQDVVA